MSESTPISRTWTHTFPWRGQEIASIVAIGLGGALLGALVKGTAGLVLDIVGPLAAVFLWWVGYSRKRNSAITVSLDGDRLDSDGRPIKQGRVILPQVTSISLTKIGSRNLIRFSDGTRSALVPVQLLGEPALHAQLVSVAASAESVTGDAADYLQSH